VPAFIGGDSVISASLSATGTDVNRSAMTQGTATTVSKKEPTTATKYVNIATELN
jgi:hypothetical protein